MPRTCRTETEKLIELVRQHPALYDQSSHDYKDAGLQHNRHLVQEEQRHTQQKPLFISAVSYNYTLSRNLFSLSAVSYNYTLSRNRFSLSAMSYNDTLSRNRSSLSAVSVDRVGTIFSKKEGNKHSDCIIMLTCNPSVRFALRCA